MILPDKSVEVLINKKLTTKAGWHEGIMERNTPRFHETLLKKTGVHAQAIISGKVVEQVL